MKTSVKVLIGITGCVVLFTACFSVYAICTINNNKKLQEFYDYQASVPSQPAVAAEEDDYVDPNDIPYDVVDYPSDYVIQYIEDNHSIEEACKAVNMPYAGYTSSTKTEGSNTIVSCTLNNTTVNVDVTLADTGTGYAISVGPLYDKVSKFYPLIYWENGIPSDLNDVTAKLYSKYYESCANQVYTTTYVPGRELAIFDSLDGHAGIAVNTVTGS